MMCDKCNELLIQLELFQNKLNGGRGMNCIDTIIYFLKRNDLYNAYLVAENERDKITGCPYSDVVSYFQDNFWNKIV